MAAEGLGSLICLWIFRYFSSLSFAKISSSPVGLEPAARAELSRSFLARSCSAIPPPLCPLCSTSKAPGSEVSRPHRFGGSRGSRGREPCPWRSQGAKNPPGSGWVWFSLRAGRQVIDDDDSSTRRSRRSRRSVTQAGSLRPAAAACATAFIWNQLTYPEGPFRSSASALLHALRSPVREAAVSSLLAKPAPI